ncbi:MAG TPA: hypothetical protein VFP84_10765 [Kofleriaceae bacterium]|nr:hypothetical protein [Kofleriaceae bacterium]
MRAAVQVMHVLERVPSAASGALVRARPDGSLAGALLVERGRVCWAMSQRSRRLTDILVAEQDSLSRAELAAVVAMCTRDRRPFGETLIERGLISLPVLHRALLRHTCEALDCLVRDDAESWAWRAHSGYGYHPMLTFSPAELLAGVRALAHPMLAAQARDRLREVVRPGQLGFAMERAAGARLPLAQIGCECVDLAALGDLAAQAADMMAVASVAGVAVALAELDAGGACASWNEGNVSFVVLCDGDLAFNRLLAQMAMVSAVATSA